MQATDDMAWLKRHVHAGRELLQRLQLDSSRLQKKPVHHRSSVIGRYGETKSVVPAAPGINLPQTDGFSLSRKIKVRFLCHFFTLLRCSSLEAYPSPTRRLREH